MEDEAIRRLGETMRNVAENARKKAEEARTQATAALAIANQTRRELVDLTAAVREQRIILREMLESGAGMLQQGKTSGDERPRVARRRSARAGRQRT